MSYRAARWPKFVFGSLAGLALLYFAVMIVADMVPQIHERYQRSQIRKCEEIHRVGDDAWRAIFAFDAGGRHIIGDSPEKRALIQCIAEKLSVEHADKPFSQDDDVTLTALSITHFSFHAGLSIEYYQGAGMDRPEAD